MLLPRYLNGNVLIDSRFDAVYLPGYSNTNLVNGFGEITNGNLPDKYTPYGTGVETPSPITTTDSYIAPKYPYLLVWSGVYGQFPQLTLDYTGRTNANYAYINASSTVAGITLRTNFSTPVLLNTGSISPSTVPIFTIVGQVTSTDLYLTTSLSSGIVNTMSHTLSTEPAAYTKLVMSGGGLNNTTYLMAFSGGKRVFSNEEMVNIASNPNAAIFTKNIGISTYPTTINIPTGPRVHYVVYANSVNQVPQQFEIVNGWQSTAITSGYTKVDVISGDYTLDATQAVLSPNTTYKIAYVWYDGVNYSDPVISTFTTDVSLVTINTYAVDYLSTPVFFNVTGTTARLRVNVQVGT